MSFSGYPEEVAIELLASVQNNIHLLRAEHELIQAEESQLDNTEVYRSKLKIITDYLRPPKKEGEKEEAKATENGETVNEINEKIEEKCSKKDESDPQDTKVDEVSWRKCYPFNLSSELRNGKIQRN